VNQRSSERGPSSVHPLGTSEDFIIDLFCRVDVAMAGVGRHPQASLWPSEVVTLAILYALKGRRQRAFYRWATRDLRHLFPSVPHRTRLFRLFAAHHEWAHRFLAGPTLFGIADSFGIELIAMRRLGRSARQIAKRGFCGGRWIAGAKLGLVINGEGQLCAWDLSTANAYDANAFAPLIQGFAGRMLVLADCNFHKSPFHRKGDPDPPNLRTCARGQCNWRRMIETVLSMIDGVCAIKRLGERSWATLRAHVAFVAAAFNILTSWDGRPELSLARFSL
jgi:hypothetical protein